MASRVEIFDVECPASTPASAPVEVAVAFDPGLVEKVEVIIPDGHAGLTGIALAVAHQPVIPFNRRSESTAPWRFIEGNDEEIPFKLDDYPDSGAWSAFLFNADVNAHRWQLRFEINELARGAIAAAPTATALALTASGEVVSGEAEPSGGTAAPPSPPEAEPTTPPEGEAPPPAPPEAAPPPEGAAPEGAEPPPESLPAPPPEGPEPGEPPAPAPPSTEEETEGAERAPAPGAPPSRRPSVHPKGPPAKSRFVVRVTHEELPAGGWLPHGARYTPERTDQGQDGITNWRGRIVAPGTWECIAVLHDRPFPSGFGPSYPVLRITSGRFGGHDWYVGHCTSTVRVGQRGHEGDTVAHADQGLRDGGGWFEIGEAPGGVPGPMGTGARFGHLFGPLVLTHSRRVKVEAPKFKAPKPRGVTHVTRKPPPPRGPERRGAGPPRRAPGPRPGPRPRPVPVRAPVPVVHRPSPAPRAAPPPVYHPPPPPPPPRPRPPAPRPVRRR